MLVRTRDDDIRGHSSTAPGRLPLGVEVLPLARLRARAAARELTRPLRSELHCMLTLTSGTLEHGVDFTVHTVRPAAWLWVRPGQVQRWGDLTGAEGTLIRFERGFLDSDAALGVRADDPHAPVLRTPGTEEHTLLRAACSQLQWEFDGVSESLAPDARSQVLRHLLAVLVLRVGALPTGRPAPTGVYAAFRDMVERDFARTRRLADYAAALGRSPRTLSRATLAHAGVPAKEFIDRRVVLEAKRLLACGPLPAARIGAELGFSSATNFSKFFRERTGTTPIAFRRAMLR